MAGSGGVSAEAAPKWALLLVRVVGTVLLAALTTLTLVCLYVMSVEEIGTALWGTHGRIQVTSAKSLENSDGLPVSEGAVLTGDFTSDSGDEHATGVTVTVGVSDDVPVAGDTPLPVQVWLWTPVTDRAYLHPGVLYPLLRAPLIQGFILLPPFLMWWVARTAWAKESAKAKPATDETP